MKFLKQFLIIPIFISMLVHSEEVDDVVTYEIEVMIYSTPNFETEEIFNIKNTFSIDDDDLISLSSPDKTINLKAMNESFKYESKFTDIFKNILFINTEKIEKESFSNNSGFWFRELKEGNTLNTLKRRILRRNDYVLLDHFTWHQGAADIEKSPYVFLHNDKYGLYIKTYKSRYLHLDVKGYLENNFNSPESMDKKFTANNKLRDFFIDQDIRVFPNEIYYFDHPKFGVVISIKDKP